MTSYVLINANIHGHSQSVQLEATSARISGTKFGPETHIVSRINVIIQVFHYLTQWQSHPRAGGFSDLVILGQIRRVNIYIEWYNLWCEIFLSQLLWSVHLCNIQNFYTFKIFIHITAILVLNDLYFGHLLPKYKESKTKKAMGWWKLWILHRCTLHMSWDKNISHLRLYPSIYMFTLQICSKMTKSEKAPAPGVALAFWEVMKKLNYRIAWQGKVLEKVSET